MLLNRRTPRGPILFTVLLLTAVLLTAIQLVLTQPGR